MCNQVKLMTKLSEGTLSLWAKKDSLDGKEKWLPLIQHLVDAENVINWLYQHFLNDSQRSLLEDTLTIEETEKIVKFIGFFHDIGKATPAFQTKQSYIHDEDLDQDLFEKLIDSGFTKLDEYIPSLRSKSPHAEAGEAILERNGLNDSVGAIIGGHHGKPLSFAPTDQIDNFTSNYYQSDHDRPIQLNWINAQKELINFGLASVGYQSLDQVPVVTEPVAVLLEGLLIMADWLSSSEYLECRPLFPLVPLNCGFNEIDSQRRFQRGILNWIQNDQWEPQNVRDIAKHYQHRWGFSPRVVQEKISESIAKTEDPGMIVIEAPMGIGKTEIALMAVEQLAARTGRNGLYMGLPTQATTNAMFSRIKSWLTSISKDSSASLDIKLMHGKAQFNPEYKDIPEASNISDDSTSNAVVVNSWFSGKKSILAEFTVGTIDQLLRMSLKQKHLFLRHLGLSGKIVIIDEVHAYDVYMSSYLTRAIEWLGAYHVPVIALSATLPKEKRRSLLKAYARGKFGKSRLIASRTWEDNQSYPLLTMLDGQQLIQNDDFPDNSSTKVKVVKFHADDQETISKIVEKISNGGIAGVVVNTVKRAQQLARLVPKDIPLILLHSAFLAPDRSKLETKLQAKIGKHGKRPHRLIVIGTQVLEQSLDIDFDVLFTDIAPMDLILQRMGRMHRHKIKRPAGLSQPEVFVMGINGWGDYGDANEAIYERYYLMKTDHFLKAQIDLPNDISTLVQAVYDQSNDDSIKGLAPAKIKCHANVEKEKNKAKVFQISRPKPRRTIHGWLDNDEPGADVSEVRAEAAVRDIKESLEVILIKHLPTGDELLDGQKLNQVKDKFIAQQLIRVPSAVTPSIDDAIKKLETVTSKLHPEWQESLWLKGSLLLPLDESNEYQFNGWQLKYSNKLGLMYRRIDDGE